MRLDYAMKIIQSIENDALSESKEDKGKDSMNANEIKMPKNTEENTSTKKKSNQRRKPKLTEQRKL